ncbi:MAG: MBL fold metallo-hydrolase [Treponema sp.]|nr:MBL fold metallo-hydrolase [Treponema sp.]
MATERIMDGLYRLPVPLPGSPLKAINTYVLTSDSRNVIIDTGYNMPECLEAMRAGIAELGLDMEKTDLLATHFHADHTGLITQLVSPKSKVYMGSIDKALWVNMISTPDAHWSFYEDKLTLEGYPPDEMEKTRMHNPARRFVSSGLVDIIELEDGDKVRGGGREWQVVLTQGHTPGHICLYDAASKTLVAGDTILFDITPNITWWRELDDSLGSFLESLDRLSKLDVEITLPSHRSNNGSMYNRIEELKAHHANRLQDVLRIARENPGINGYEIASKMTWAIRARDWDDFPPGQRWFAVGEAISHINHLTLGGKLKVENVGGVNRYTCA